MLLTKLKNKFVPSQLKSANLVTGITATIISGGILLASNLAYANAPYNIKLFVKEITALKTSEKNGDEIYFIMTEYLPNSKKVRQQDRVPNYPNYIKLKTKGSQNNVSIKVWDKTIKYEDLIADAKDKAKASNAEAAIITSPTEASNAKTVPTEASISETAPTELVSTSGNEHLAKINLAMSLIEQDPPYWSLDDHFGSINFEFVYDPISKKLNHNIITNPYKDLTQATITKVEQVGTDEEHIEVHFKSPESEYSVLLEFKKQEAK